MSLTKILPTSRLDYQDENVYSTFQKIPIIVNLKTKRSQTSKNNFARPKTSCDGCQNLVMKLQEEHCLEQQVKHQQSQGVFPADEYKVNIIQKQCENIAKGGYSKTDKKLHKTNKHVDKVLNIYSELQRAEHQMETHLMLDKITAQYHKKRSDIVEMEQKFINVCEKENIVQQFKANT